MRTFKKTRLLRVICTVCIVVSLFYFTGNPSCYLDAQTAEECKLHGMVDWKNIDIPSHVKAKIIPICAKAKAAWLPMPDYGSPLISNDPETYVDLVFPGQLFLDIFLLEDGSVYAYAQPWHGDGRSYAIKNPEVLRDVFSLLSSF